MRSCFSAAFRRSVASSRGSGHHSAQRRDGNTDEAAEQDEQPAHRPDDADEGLHHLGTRYVNACEEAATHLHSVADLLQPLGDEDVAYPERTRIEAAGTVIVSRGTRNRSLIARRAPTAP